jgi:hypothetical protein
MTEIIDMFIQKEITLVNKIKLQNTGNTNFQVFHNEAYIPNIFEICAPICLYICMIL